MDYSTIVSELDEVLVDVRLLVKSVGNRASYTKCVTLVTSAVQRWAPVGSAYQRMLDVEQNRHQPAEFTRDTRLRAHHAEFLVGILDGLRDDYARGRMRVFEEKVRSELFTDMLELADYLLAEGLKDAAAVYAGAVMEEHLRLLCKKANISLTFTDAKGDTRQKKLDVMNAELCKAGTYGSNEQKQITAWAGLRNSAAHGKFAECVKSAVEGMISGLRDFIGRFPA